MQMCFFYRFILENGPLDKYVRYIVTIYPVVIWALTGVYTKNYSTEAQSPSDIFIGEKHNKYNLNDIDWMFDALYYQ